MDKNLSKIYYSKLEIQKEIIKFAKNREIGTRFEKYFGKRPDIIDNNYDIKKLIENEIESFHMSEEIWENPLLLENKNISQNEKNKNRNGWDLILDLDGVDFIYAQIAGEIILNFLNNLGIKNVSCKFSGNKGFHIAIPFKAFSKNIIGIGETKNLFPEAARKIASYLMFELKTPISTEILKKDKTIDNLSKKYNIPLQDLVNDDPKSNYLNFEKIIEIDTILIASRHLFRMPYSLHEKSQLVSIPVENSRLKKFKKEEAKIENINLQKYKKFNFLEYNQKYGTDADILLIKSYEDNFERNLELEKRAKKLKQERIGRKTGLIFEGDHTGDQFEINEEINEIDFPETIKYIIKTQFPDGKKRAIFLILTYLHSIKYKNEKIDNIIEEWNKNQEFPLKPNYIHAQLSWFNSKISLISPPNFKNDNYYKGIGIPEEIIKKDLINFKTRIKNPLHHTYITLQKNKAIKEAKEKQNKKENKKKSKKEEK